MPPATPLQHALVGIWEDLLQIEEVGIEDDFFELGGHSLLVARLMARVEAELGVRLPLSVLFEGTRIRDLERAILESGEGRVPGSQVIEVQGGESPTPFFFLHGDLVGGGLYTRGLAEGLGVEEAVQVLAPHGVEGDAVPGSVAEMAAEYCATIREIQPEGPYRLGGFCLGGQVAYELACQLERAGEQVEPLVLIDTPLLAGKRARRVHRVVSWVGERLQLDLDTRRQSFDLVMRVLRDLALLRKLPLRERVQVSLLLLLKSLLLVRGLTRSRRREAGSPRGADGGSGVDRGVLVAHEWAQAGWKPGRYGGRVHLFSVRDGSWQPERLADRWRQVTGEVALHALPGTHVSCLTDDLPHLAAAMRAVLDMHNPASMHCEDQVRELAGPGNR